MPTAAGYHVAERRLVGQTTAVIHGCLPASDIVDWVGPAFEQVLATVRAEGLRPTGPPFARYTAVPTPAGSFDVEAGIPVDRRLPSRQGTTVQPSRLPAGRAAVTVHVGDYSGLVAAYEAIESWLAERSWRPSGAPWEGYLSEPDDQPEDWRTEIVQPFRTT